MYMNTELLQYLEFAHQNYPYVCLLNSNTEWYKSSKLPPHYQNFDWILGAAHHVLQPEKPYFDWLQTQIDQKKWLLGYLGYDLKNEVEPQLGSKNTDSLGFEEMVFFEPSYLIICKKGKIEVLKNDEKTDLQPLFEQKTTAINAQSCISKAEYIEKVVEVKRHIFEGTVYELNFCMEFLAENAVINPLNTFKILSEISPTPFSAYLKLKNKYLLCASPERFLRKKGAKLLSQPIKGTAARKQNALEDKEQAKKLFENEKERAENVMIVDLVRNDLAKSSVAGSVKVSNLFKVYTFPKVFQMISSVRSVKLAELSIAQVLKNAFPMGSMTGAPKVQAMQLIEQLEDRKRGIYSGALGYIAPDQNFDFNVVIRSIAYNETAQKLSFSVGSAITHDSQPEAEYDECLLKAQTMVNALKI